MGYYSEVSILCGRNVARRIVELTDLFDAVISSRDDGCYQFYWESVKWYESIYKEVDAVMNVVKDYLSKDYGEDGARREDFCSFIRIGENDGDVTHETNSCVFDDQWVQCKVCVSGGEFSGTLDHDDARKKLKNGDW